MELADIASNLIIAKAVLKQVGDVGLPIPIEDIAYAVGITDIQEVETKGFEGALIAPDHKRDGVILINRNSRLERRRYGIGHELGHFLNPWHKPPEGGFRCTKADMFARADGGASRLRMEKEANEFSAELLMPATLFQRDLRKLKSPGLEHIVALAKRYATSKFATAWRFVDLHDELCAILQTKDHVLQQCHRHPDFPFIDLRFGQCVNRNSLTATFTGGDGCSSTESTEPSLWCSTSLPRGAEMFEQVLIQAEGYRLTLLSVDTSDSDDEEEEHERNRSAWPPQFRR
jgi:Zn-dependent peptidase ImmA (M78 family)